ncbi:MAG: flippase-like domain-containing protein [Elusimicrobia bacterium]|nr:flippase-like domain-containing protein [Elusimicrobiota bacterium]MDE2236453.1 flippase-like domain-containing protein [Elusimicrobiota bacterium]MDE2425056.1 flippase-like domain-containing protein [Elusimicrobiota bacterium]
MGARRRLWPALTLAITVFLSWLALRGVGARRLGGILLHGVRLPWLVVLLGLTLVELWLRARRWSLLLGGPSRAPALELFKLDTIGTAVSNVLFLRLGDLARGLLAARKLEIPAATVLASIALERALDLSVLLAVFTLASALSPRLVPDRARAAGALLLAAAVLALAALALAEKPLAPEGAFDLRLRRWPRLRALVRQLAAGAAALRRAAVAGQVIALSLVFWSVDACFYWAAGNCLGIGSALSYARSLLVVSWAAAGSALPSSPGSFGAVEEAVKTIVSSMGVPPDRALAYAFFSHVVGYLIVTAIGLFCLYRVGIPLAGLRAELSRPSAGSAGETTAARP